MVPLDVAAKELGIDPKRLLGHCMNRQPWMPIAGKTDTGVMVYGWSCRALAERMAAAGDKAVVETAP